MSFVLDYASNEHSKDNENEADSNVHGSNESNEFLDWENDTNDSSVRLSNDSSESKINFQTGDSIDHLSTKLQSTELVSIKRSQSTQCFSVYDTPDQSLTAKDESSTLHQSATKDHCSSSDHDEPNKSFEEMGISKEVLNALKEKGIEKPNDLQSNLLPELIKNKTSNIFVKSFPHSFKTTAYLIGAIERIDTSIDRVQCVILHPSLLAAVNTAEAAKEIGKYKVNFKVDFVTKFSELADCNGHLVVLTIEQMQRLLNTRTIGKIDLIIIDQLDLLFQKDNNITMISEVFKAIKDKVGQYQFYSNAPGNYALNVVRNRNFISSDPVILDEMRLDWMKNFLHFFTKVEKKSKYKVLLKLIDCTMLDKLLIFVRSKQAGQHLCKNLREDGYKNKICSLIGGTNTKERLIAINDFNKLPKAILIVQYPVALGIPFEDLSLIINYDLPQKYSSLFSEYFLRITSVSKIRDGKPNFIVNLVDSQVNDNLDNIKRIEEYFACKMIKLIVGSVSTKDRVIYFK